MLYSIVLYMVMIFLKTLLLLKQTQSAKDKVTYLERRLKSVISEERYEEAAAIRKEINRLKEKANKS